MSGRIVSRLRERERNFDRAIDISRSIEKIANSLPMFRRVNALNTCNQLLQHLITIIMRKLVARINWYVVIEGNCFLIDR